MLLQCDDYGSADPIYMWPQVKPLFGGLSRTTVWRMIRAGKLPQPVQISPGRRGWLHSDILVWQAQRAMDGRKPEQGLRAKYGL